ncbi:hypothetical protein GWL_45750 [Herbaspirillum sp. GW103]|uniref:thiol-disulfide oxidoreductase DCC family protein n=1 Tax=Herbaspirillum sp. GW103 TaxID=1175306 RepID=UPI00025E4CBC|nr:DCC1-like thiol-disulfide oxidoreductase family protein [Herbaspirillum sp. GW103]EIJ45135.1 hypothetical protein GWL_45750 [Herbaspirillum sp. GW103]
MADADPKPRDELTVLYDGACPLCRREISLYQRGAQEAPLRFCDISRTDVSPTDLPAGFTRAQLLARFHVRRSDGVVFSGAEAFVQLWASLPGWRWLAGLARLPGMLWLMERSYRAFLQVRPAVRRLVVRLERRRERG